MINRFQRAYRAFRSPTIALTAAPAPTLKESSGADLRSILRPQSAYRWIWPQVAAVTPAYIQSILRGAFAGSHVQAWELFDLMEDTWPRLSKNLNELKRAVVAMNWELQPWQEEDTPPTASAEEKMKLISSALWRMQPDPCCDQNGFQQTMYDVLDAWGKGISVLEILWHSRRAGPLGDIIAPQSTIWVRPDNYAWNDQGRLGLNPNALNAQPGKLPNPRAYLSTPAYYARPEDIIEFPPEKFLIAVSKAKTGHPLCAALLRPLAWWWCASNFCSDWLMNLAQIFGLPFRWANYADGTADATVDKICAMLENMGSNAWAAFPAGTTLELKEASKSGDNSPQGDLLDRADKNCDLLILGQTLTTDTGGMGQGGGSLALGKVHADVKKENVQAAANWTAEIINRQFIPSILRLNYGDDEEPPEFKPQPNEQKDEQAEATRDTTLMAAGIEMPKKWFFKRHGIPLPQPGEEVVGGKPEPELGAPGGPTAKRPLSGPQADNADDNSEETSLSAAARRGQLPPRGNVNVSRLAVAFAEDLQPLRTRLERILQIDDTEILRAKLSNFVEQLPSLLKDINADPESARVFEDEMRSGILHIATRR